MSLILTVNAQPETLDGAPARMVFGAAGGRIGRGRSNDWVLPDEQRYMSSNHVHICCIDGQYFVEDLSSNGTYLNSETEPLGKIRSRALRNGDRLRMGTYRFQVELADESPTTRLKGSDAPDATGEEMLIDHSQRVSRLERTGPPPERRDPPPRQAAPGLSELESFCRGAGIDQDSLGENMNSGMLYIAGLLLREALVGARELLESQRTIRSGAQLPAPAPTQRDTNLQRSSVEDLMRQLLTCERAEALENVHWLREQFSQARRHDHALINALRFALGEYLRRLDPQSLGDGAAALSRFRNLTDMEKGGMPAMFVEALARHFAAEFQPPQSGGASSRSAA